MKSNEEKKITSKKNEESREWGEIKKKAQEYDTLWERYLRVCAELDNARKRWEKEKEEVIKFANFRLMKEIISVLDNLEKMMEGVGLMYKSLLDTLSLFGLKRIEAKGKKFDPHYHEIVGQKEADEKNHHFVLEEVQAGYLLGDKVLRASKVIIGVKKNQENPGGDKNG
ncbi:MAG: nucleotide exchange factor GrpE [Candidatus Omnitrophota bacterium]|nr:MAG: nucleotide exchange factor GrpE [Candidatus Omnitrophota bacterium]